MKQKSSTHKLLLVSLFTSSLALTSCVKDIDEPAMVNTGGAQGTVTDINQMIVPSYFNYETDKNVVFNITIKDNSNQPIPNIKVNIMDKAPEDGGLILLTGFTDGSGEMTAESRIGINLSEVIINTDYIGITNNVIASVNGATVNSEIGGSNPQRLRTVRQTPKNQTENYAMRVSSVPTKTYLGTWNSDGVPNYLESTRDNISSTFLARINNSLPERRAVPTYNPEYLESTAKTTLDVTTLSDVWITFVHEGAGYRNTLAYYTYTTGSAPTSTNDIAEIKIIFPNFSYSGSGGGMVSGDKVNIGQFASGTSIGFVILANGYNTSDATVGNGYGQYYSDKNLNPENSSLNQHNVILWDDSEQKFIIGFEDINRTSSSCDNDFNDAIFFASTNPVNGVNRTGCPHSEDPTDSDADGVSDLYDDYPNDATKATNNYYPTKTTFARLAFEDLWPDKGDYDMNDMIVSYRFNQIKNASNKVVQLDGKFAVQSIGGSYFNGFGFELPVSPSVVSNVTGMSLHHNLVTLAANNCEAAQNKAVVIVFDHANDLLPRPSGYYSNTQNGAPYINSDTANISVQFTTAQSTTALGSCPFNPFMFINNLRGKEVHLPNKTPTTLATTALLGTGADASNPATGVYYKTKTNLPYALNIPADFGTVLEKSSVMQAYSHFAAWAQSGGSSYANWYSSASGYRNSQYLYQH